VSGHDRRLRCHRRHRERFGVNAPLPGPRPTPRLPSLRGRTLSAAIWGWSARI